MRSAQDSKVARAQRWRTRADGHTARSAGGSGALALRYAALGRIGGGGVDGVVLSQPERAAMGLGRTTAIDF